ncbi:hypothetical protein HDU67_010227 [Dinochytrium kinnereticum]|nr:hypothetical protein HDU67_010227 [Dinochytrium kinnereticum]
MADQPMHLSSSSSRAAGNTPLAAENLVRPPSALHHQQSSSPSSPSTIIPPSHGGHANLLTIHVKCPTLPDLAFSVHCAKGGVLGDGEVAATGGGRVLGVAATVADLKLALQESYPLAPKVDDQRLIFAGSLLADHQPLLSHVFRKSDLSAPQTVHLVVKNAVVTTQTDSKHAKATPTVKFEDPSGLRHRFSSNATLSASLPQSSNDLGNEPSMTSPIAPFNPSPSASFGENSAVPMMDAAMQSQLAVMMAGHQFAIQNGLPPPIQVVMINGMPYVLQLNPNAVSLPGLYSNAPGSQPNPATTSAPPPVPIPQDPQPQPQLPAAAAPAPAPLAPVAPAAPVNNAVGGGAAGIGGGFAGFMQQENPDDEFGDLGRNEPQNPIWLLMKLTFVVWMFSHNASPTRFVILNLVAFVIFFVQMGWVQGVWPFRNRAQAPQPGVGGEGLAAPLLGEQQNIAENNGEIVEGAPVAPVADAAAVGGAPTIPANEGDAPVVAPAVPRIQLTLWQEVTMMVTTFFTSLIPEQNEVI